MAYESTTGFFGLEVNGEQSPDGLEIFGNVLDEDPSDNPLFGGILLTPTSTF